MTDYTGNNPARGCGHLKPGGCYLQGKAGPNGTLDPLIWVLGRHTQPLETAGIVTEIPPRRMLQFDPEMTLDQGAFMPVDVAAAMRASSRYGGAARQELRRLGRFALVDRVGESHYSAFSFAMELRRLGPSRRISPDVAAQIARHLPCPVFFAHPSVPVFGSESHAHGFYRQILEQPLEGKVGAPTWNITNWGMRVDQDHGDNHYLIPVLRYLHESKDWHDLGRTEMLFAASWFTQAVYVLDEGEDVLPDALKGSGIQPIRADAPEVA